MCSLASRGMPSSSSSSPLDPSSLKFDLLDWLVNSYMNFMRQTSHSSLTPSMTVSSVFFCLSRDCPMFVATSKGFPDTLSVECGSLWYR